MARAAPLKLIGSADGSKFRAAAKPSPSLPVLREVKGVSSVSTRAGKAALARAPPRERHGTRYVEMSDDESHDEGLLLSPHSSWMTCSVASATIRSPACEASFHAHVTSQLPPRD